MLAVIKDNFEEPVGSGREVFARHTRGTVAVLDVLEIALSEFSAEEPVFLLWRCSVYVLVVLAFVFIENSIALVVVALADKPGEYTGRVVGVGNAGILALAVEGGDVVLGNGPPVADPRLFVRPALDACEESFYPGTVALNGVTGFSRGRVKRLAYPCAVFFDQDRNQILGTGEDENVGLFRVSVAG
jgi:hypothetical protein